jgi:uncharacterized membrane protein
MSKRATPASVDLAVTAVAALASFALALLPFGGTVKEIALVPLALALPGYAFVAAMFPPGTISRAERLVYTVCLSIGAAVLCGLFWQLLFELDRFTWALLLTLATLIASAVAQRRRIASPRPVRLRAAPRPGLPTVLAMVIAIAVAVEAISLAADGLENQHGGSRFAALWIVPGPDDGSVDVGVSNHLGATHEYRLRIDRGGMVLRNLRLRLGPHQHLQTTLSASELVSPALPGKRQVVATLYKDGTIYRRTELQTGGGT